MAEAYGGLVGAYVFALRESQSWLFKSYVITSAILGLFIALLLVLAVIAWTATPVAFGERAFLGVLGLLVLIPMTGPVLLVARRHRLGATRPGADRWLGLAGYAFTVSLVLGLFVTDPSSHAVGGPLEGAVQWLDGLPDGYGLVPPVVAAGIVIVVARMTRPTPE